MTAISLTRPQLESLLSFHPSLRYVTVVGRDGRLLEEVKRPKVESLEPPEQTDRIMERFALAKGMTSGSDAFYGKLLTIVVRREKLVELLFPFSQQMLIISAESDFPMEAIPKLEGMLERLNPREPS